MAKSETVELTDGSATSEHAAPGVGRTGGAATDQPSRLRNLLRNTWVDFQQMASFAEHPLVIERGAGLYYWDTSGKRYFDAIGGIFVASLGHAHPRVLAAMQQQMQRLTFAPPMHGVADVTLDFNEKLASVTPDGLDFVKAFSGGSEATEAALKLARQYFKQTGRPGKYKVISRYLGYHGSTFGAMAASGTGPRKSPFEPQMGGFVKVFPPTHYRDRFESWEQCNRFAAQAVEDAIRAEDPATVAAVMIEPIGNTGGIITPTDEYLQMLRDTCDRHDVLLIYDEVITGFGKTGNMFAAQTFGVAPDILCCGKGISSGAIPMGALAAHTDLAQAFLGADQDNVQFMHGNTFAGNPLAAAVGSAVIDTILDEDLCGRARDNGLLLREQLEGLRRHGVVREVRGKGILLGVELTDERVGRALRSQALEHGLILRVDPGWFAVAPALVATKDELAEMCELIDLSLAAAVAEVGSAS